MHMMDQSGLLGDAWRLEQVRDLAGWADMTERAVEAIIAAVALNKGDAAGRRLRQVGLERLHEVINADEVGLLRDQVLERMRDSLLSMAVAVGRQVLAWDHDFFVDDYLILRINFPYAVARLAARTAENPGVGRLSPAWRDVYNRRKVIDPTYNPKAYHGDHPPAAWAHGPHRDSWTGHSRDGRNIWWAIGEVPDEAGMVLYPHADDPNLPCDPATLYLQAGYPLGKPTCLPMNAGEMLVFDPEILHGTHLNTTRQTRVAISMRLNAAKPTFDPACFYAREFWRRARDIEAGKDEVVVLPREEHLGPWIAKGQPAPPEGLPRVAGRLDQAAGVLRATPGSAGTARRLVIEAAPFRVMVVATRKGWKAYGASCPHNGADLADGGCDDAQLYCPVCAVGYDLMTGLSSTPLLALQRYPVTEVGGDLLIRIAP